jgi:hypothetical protein
MYKGLLKLAIGAYVYTGSDAAQRALPAFTTTATQTCIVNATVASLRSTHYDIVAQPPFVSNSTHVIGRSARTTHVTILASYRGRQLTIRVDTTAVRRAQVVEILSTVAEVPSEAAAKLKHVLTARLHGFVVALGEILNAAQRSG